MKMCATLNNRCIFRSHSIGGTTASRKGNVDQMFAYAYHMVPHVLKKRTKQKIHIFVNHEIISRTPVQILVLSEL